MARAEFINSILSGKLGGSVFSRNKAGYYVRRWANPTNPQTVAQSAARSNLASVASSWHSLSDAQKAAWNSFAVTDFKAKFGNKSGVTYSGFNAFTSLSNVQKNMISLMEAPTFDVGITSTFLNPALSFIAPTFPMSGTIKDENNVPLSLTVDSASYALGTNSVSIDFKFDRPIGGTGPSEVLPVFEDSVSGEKVGFVVSGSLPGVQEQQAIPNPDFLILAASEIIDEVTAWLTPASTDFNLTIPAVDVSKFKLFYSENDMIELRVYMYNTKGQSQPLGSIKSFVQA